VDAPVSRGKRIVILHAGSDKGWIEGCLLLSAKNIKNCSLDYHEDMSANVFEDWFENTLIPKLNKNFVVVMEHASYHSRLLHKIPNTSNTKAELMEFLYSNDM
jgi:hypothetical protein